MSEIRKKYTYDGVGNPIYSFKGAMDVHLFHGHNFPINVYALNTTATSTTLAANASAGSYTLSFTSATGFAIGDYLYINTTSFERTNPKITNIVGTTITIDRQLDTDHVIGDTVTKVIINMHVLGTQASPISFRISPPSGEVWLISRFIISMVDNVAGDLTKFGGITALTNGVIMRSYINGSYYTFTNWKTNQEIKEDMGDISFDDRAGGTGSYGISAVGSLLDLDRVQSRLDGDAGDYIEFLVQDDLTGLTNFRIKGQGLLEDA